MKVFLVENLLSNHATTKTNLIHKEYYEQSRKLVTGAGIFWIDVHLLQDFNQTMTLTRYQNTEIQKNQ